MSEYDADVIVVGSGSLGGLAALQIARAGKSVIILEAGPGTPDWKITENFRTSPRPENLTAPFGDIPYAPNAWTPGYVQADIDVDFVPGTVRSVGGTSRHWTGVAWRLLPEEMKMRSTYGIGRDWPFSYDALEPFYTQAEYEVGVNGADATDYSGRNLPHPYPPRSKPYPLPPEGKPYSVQRFQMRTADQGYQVIHAPNVRLSQPYAGRPACIGNNICNPNCPINAKHSGINDVAAARAAGAKLISGAIVDRLEKDGRGRITALSYLDPSGARSRLTARRYVIAAHGFETPKLLLMNGLANRSGMVGRNLMIHPTLIMSLFADEPLWVGRGQYLHGAIMQRRMEADRGAVAAGFYQFMNHNAGRMMASDLFKHEKLLGAPLDAEIRDRASRYLSLQLLLEDLPDPANAVTLNAGYRDALGLPGLRMRYRIPEYTKAALPRTFDDFANWLQALDAVQQAVPGTPWSNQHHIMGTVVMGDDPATSVVDADLRCHDHDNLFLVTTGVFPSSSCVNPTLTGMALAVRAGQHIASES